MSKKKHKQRPKYQAHAARQAAIAQRGKASKDVASIQKIWDEVNNMRLDTIATTTTAMAANELLNDQAKVDALSAEQRAQVNADMAKMANEVKRLVNNLGAIGKTHKGFSGAARDQEDHQYALLIYQQYVQWMDDWQASVLPLLEKVVTVFADSAGLQIEANPNGDQPGEAFVNVVEKSADEVHTLHPDVAEAGLAVEQELAAEKAAPYGVIAHARNGREAAETMIAAGALDHLDEEHPTASQIGLMNNRDTTE